MPNSRLPIIGRICCLAAAMAAAMAEPLAAEQRSAVFSTDGTTLLRPGSNLQLRRDLNDEATLQLANPLEELYLVVISESKGLLPGGATLEQYREAALDNIAKATQAMKLAEPSQLQINGHQALQTRFTASVPGIEPRVAYVLTTVESAHALHQILGWTLESLAEKNMPILLDLTATFEADLEVLRSADENVQITLPDGMTESNAFQDVTLQAIDAETERYAVVVREPKRELPEGTSLTEYYEAQVAKLKEATRGAAVAEPRRLTIDGHAAVQTTITAEFPGIEGKITYLVTDVETPDAFIHLQCWTTADRFAENQRTLQTVVDSLRVAEAKPPVEPR